MAGRSAIVAANWKMYKTRVQAAEFIAAFRKQVLTSGRVMIVICPPFTALETVRKALEGSNVKIGAQDCYSEKDGAFTGEVSAGQLKEVGCTYVIVGHSERRRLFEDTDELINRKLQACLRERLVPIFCVGESLPDREAKRTEQVIWAQLTHGLVDITPEQLKSFVIAYEPVWAIGTGRNATPEQAQEVHAFIRSFLRNVEAGIDEIVPILYGGSVKPDNIEPLMLGSDVDGALVGGASLEPSDFVAIVQGVAETRRP